MTEIALNAKEPCGPLSIGAGPTSEGMIRAHDQVLWSKRLGLRSDPMPSENLDTANDGLLGLDIQEAWRLNAGRFAKGFRPGFGFSLKYDAKEIGPQVPARWRVTVAKETDTTAARAIFTHEDGLVITREMRVLRDFDAVEYQLHFRNSSKKKLAPLSELNSLDISFRGPISDGNCVISSGGGLDDTFLPPKSFAIRKSYLSSEHGANVDLATEGGRSSNKDLPFFFLHNDAAGEGVFIAFGWSGQWLARIAVDHATSTLSIRGRIPGVEIALEPGEEIHGPTVLVGLYKGTLSDGSNRLRHLIRREYTPLFGGQPFLPVATYDTWFGLGMNYDEALLLKLADRAAEIGQEYFLLDAGWYAGTKGSFDFSAGVGNWYEVDRSRLPNGLEPIAEYVRGKGLKFGMWFEPERVAPGSALAKEHPDWILWNHLSEPENTFNAYLGNGQYGLLDYGRLEVQQWVRTMVEHYIRKLDVRYVRYDVNIDPLPYWNANDKPDRLGITQLRHVRGFYAVIDWLRARNPETVLEGCASGGRRIDLETARRFHTFWISDQTADSAIVRFHLFGINHFLPGNYHYVQYTRSSRDNSQWNDLGFQSLFGGAFGTNGRIDTWPEEMLQKAKLQVEIWKRHRRYLIEDFYALGDQPASMESWSGWQFLDPTDQSGYFQVFRGRTADATRRFFIRKLDEHARYRVMDVCSKEEFEVDGATAMTRGIEITQDPMSSRTFSYERVESDKRRRT